MNTSLQFCFFQLEYFGWDRLVVWPDFGEIVVSRAGRFAGLAITGSMFIFSTYMYTRSGDWVAAFFAVGSLAYGIFFWQQGRGGSA